MNRAIRMNNFTKSTYRRADVDTRNTGSAAPVLLGVRSQLSVKITPYAVRRQNFWVGQILPSTSSPVPLPSLFLPRPLSLPLPIPSPLEVNTFIRQKAEETDRQADRQTNKQTMTTESKSNNAKEMTKNE